MLRETAACSRVSPLRQRWRRNAGKAELQQNSYRKRTAQAILRLDLSALRAPLLSQARQGISTACRRRGQHVASSGAGGLRFAAGSEPLGTGRKRFGLLRCRSPGGRPGIAFRRATAFVPFSGRRESAARRRRGGYVASSASVGHRCPAAMLLRGHSGTGKMRLPQGQAHFSYFILFLRREGTPFNPREPAHRRKSSSPATG